jgi:U4/U6 small nuclear ribonucleoprotein PRP3
MMAHPLLLEQAPTAAPTSKKDRYKPMLPKFASIKANARVALSAPGPGSLEPVKANPYTSSGGPTAHEGFEGMPKERVGRNLRFNQKGKYIAQANQMRQEVRCSVSLEGNWLLKSWAGATRGIETKDFRKRSQSWSR